MEETYPLRDALKQVLHVNDDVVFVQPYSKALRVGTVVKVSASSVKVKYLVDSLTSSRTPVEMMCRRHVENVVRITQQVQIAKEENPEEYI
jgi:hypothetical protein